MKSLINLKAYEQYVPKEPTMTTVAELERQYENFSASTRDIGKGIARSVSMLQLDEVQETIASAVIQIEKVTNKTDKSAFSKLPFLGKYFQKAKEEIKEEQLKSGSMTEVVDRLFEALLAKKENIVSVADTLYNLKDKLIQEVQGLEQQESQVLEITHNDGSEGFKARNLLVQIQPTLIGAKDRIGVIDATIRSAEVCSTKISSMLPALHGGLITEMSIQAGLQELSDFKQVFDATVDVVEDLNRTNNESMNKVLLDVVDLAVSNPTKNAVSRIENLNKDRSELQMKVKAKLAKATQEQQKTLESLAEVRQAQTSNLLNFSGE